MKAYIEQIFYEGLGKTLYFPVESLLKKIKNKNTSKYLITIFRGLYFIFSITLALLLLYIKL